MGLLSLSTLRSIASQLSAQFKNSENKCRQVINAFQLIGSHFTQQAYINLGNTEAFTTDELVSLYNVFNSMGSVTLNVSNYFTSLTANLSGTHDVLTLLSGSNPIMIASTTGLKIVDQNLNIQSIVTQLQASACVNDWIATVADNVRGFTKENLSSIYTTFVAKYRSIPEGANAFIGASIERLQNGGLLNFFFTLKTALQNFVNSLSYQDDTFTFTDVTQFCPQSFVAGVLAGSFLQALEVIGAILLLVNRTIGIITLIVTNIVSFISNAINNTVKKATHVTANDTFDLTMRVWPFPLWQKLVPALNCPPNIKSVVEESNAGIVGFEIPGGILICWHQTPSDFTTAICMEFHPSTTVNYGVFHAGFWMYEAPVSPSITYKYKMPASVKGEDVLESYFNHSGLDIGYYNNIGSDDFDKFAYNHMYMAIAWFITWVLASIPNDSSSDGEFRGWLANYSSAFVGVAETYVKFFEPDNPELDHQYNAHWFIGMLMDCARCAEYDDYYFGSETGVSYLFQCFETNYLQFTSQQFQTFNVRKESMPVFVACIPQVPWTMIEGDDYIPSMWPALDAYDEFLDSEDLDFVPWVSIDVQPVYELNLPTYSTSDVIGGLVTLGVATITTIAVATAVFLAVKKEVNTVRAKQIAKIEAAHNALVENPTSANAATYRTEAFKYNYTWGLLSGDKFSYTDYWGSSSSNPGITSPIDTLDYAVQSLSGISDVSDDGNVSLLTIKTLIAG